MDNPMATFKDDIDAARTAITSEIENGYDVIVVSHSYGGMVGNSVIKGLAKNPFERQDQDDTGHVVGLILIASGFTFTGVGFMDLFFGRPPPAWRVNKETGYAEIVVRPQDFFYSDMPPAEADYRTSMLSTQSLKALFEGGEHAYSGWMDVPVWYIGTTYDRGLPVIAQRTSVGMARAMGGHVMHTELPTSHSPFLSQPAQVVQICLQAYQEFTGESVDGASGELGTAQAHSPVPRLWQPTTWYRFGLPLGVGTLVGWTILLYRNTRGVWMQILGSDK
ncbi:alpha beta-hydrolase [Fusarium heterosporum]|uniref:Alpha beta-hydrolase n=1 Tax=Fusarium heterosporum TaxID=42747 RepID=A0A8H5WI53_FUSHE|nr:alpha beta-hydrolase [Fusarium heterosporum]